jgi:DNA-binding CsgD family transcriptional regulator
MLSREHVQMAERIVEAARMLAARNRAFPTLRSAALHATGLLKGDPEYLLESAANHALPWVGASAREDAGALLAARTGEHGKAVAALEQAMDEYHALGSTLDVTRVRSKLLKLGNRYHYARWSVEPPATHRDLTYTEARIVGLVSQGLSNAQIADQIYLSRHTVAFHLKRIFKKLGVSSRGELASRWFQLTAGEHVTQHLA